MSMPGTSIFTERVDDLMNPEFTKVLKGYDPMEVDAYVFASRERIEELEREARTMRDERDVARRQFTDIAEDVYREIADRMADVIAAADKQAQKMLAEAELEASLTREAADREADTMRRRSAAELERLERQGDERIRLANAEVDRILGGLMLRRDDIVAELGLVRQRTLGVVEKIDAAVSVASVSARVPEPPAPVDVSRPNGAGPVMEPGGTNGSSESAEPRVVKIPSDDLPPGPRDDSGPDVWSSSDVGSKATVADDDFLPFERGLETF